MENNIVVIRKSTLWKGSTIILLVLLGFFALKGTFGTKAMGNAAAPAADPYASFSFQEVCAKTGGMWMRMQPTQNGVPTGGAACAGCMAPGGDHICEKDRYLEARKTR